MGCREGQLEGKNEAPGTLIGYQGHSPLIETRKPDSVSDDHFSGTLITEGLKQSTRNLGWSQPQAVTYLTLLRVGFTLFTTASIAQARQAVPVRTCT